MMDRNTLTALLLITLVLILTPYYMGLVSPPQQIDYELLEQELEAGDGVSGYVDTTIEKQDGRIGIERRRKNQYILGLYVMELTICVSD